MKYIIVMVLALGLSGCGNTITGFGKDVSTVGEKELIPISEVVAKSIKEAKKYYGKRSIRKS